MSTQSPIIVIRAEHLILMSMINVKRTRFNVVLLMLKVVCSGIVDIADVARTRFNVVLFDVGKKMCFNFGLNCLCELFVCLNCLNFGLKC